MVETVLLRIAAVLLVVTGIVWLRRREFGVGWEGEPPSFYVRGAGAAIAGVVLIIAGIVFFIWPGLLGP